MNYAGKFGSGTPDNFSSAGFKIDAPGHQGGGDSVTIPDAHLLFSGDYSRSGADLIVSDHLHRVVVPNYFHGDKRPALLSPDGAPLDPAVIEAMTGHVQYAQAAGTAAAAAAKVVGHVVKMTGSASVVRNGVTITLNNGDTVLQNDVVQTGSGSSVGLVMIDGTTFNLSAGARLMLNDLTYDASSTSNSSLFTLVQGAASFVAGQVAKTGDMKVGTPVATMGIRGTAVILDISAVDGKVSVSVIDQRDGQVHSVQVYNSRGVLIGTVTSNGSTLTLTPIANFEVIAQESNKTVAQIQQEFSIFREALTLYEIQKAIDPNLPQHTEYNANPRQYAAAGSTPANPPAPVYTPVLGSTPGPAGDGPPATVVLNLPPVPGTPGTTPVQPSPIVVTLNIPNAPLPFVVTPPTVNQISGPGGDHFGPVMSADGHFIVYDPDGSIFLYHHQTHTTITVAEAGGGFTYGGQTISADGRYVVFQGTNGTQSFVYIYNNDPSDVAHYQQTTQLAAGGAPSISGDGSRIVIEHGGNSIGIYDQQGHVIATVTAAAIGETGAVWLPAVSADGHLIAFWQTDAATPGGSGQLFVYDLTTGTATAIASTATDAGNAGASFSADGRYVVYQSDAPGGHSEIYLYDLSTGQVVFQTANASGASYHPVISPDGNYIIFASDAELAGDGNAVTDTYVVDVSDPAHPVYNRVSNLANGNQPDGNANLGATISAGGLYIAFASSSAPGTGDVFLADPTSGRSAIIQERASSPAILTAGGVIALTGDHNGATLGVANPNGRFTASFNAQGDIVWSFSEPKSDFAALLPGQKVTQDFIILLTNDSGTTQIPVRVVVYDADLPVTFAVANPGTIAGDNNDNTLTGTADNDILQGFGGDDTLNGLAGFDRAVYTDATGGITVDLADGTVTGQGVGADTLIGIEAIQGSNFADHYSAVGFTGSSGLPGVPTGFNSFEGMAGDDIITGNVNVQGQALTRISYASASAAVVVDLAAGTATGNASVGTDHFTNVSSVIGSGYGDTLRGSDNENGSFEQFDGRGGNDTIEGRGGYDFATYNSDAATHSGITVNLAAGTVTGDASVGTDTLRGVEGARGTHFADTYNAVGFNAGSTNAGSSGSFNNFDGQGGNDSITGNGNTRIQYSQSTAAVFVDLAYTAAGGTGVALDRADAINLTNLDLASVGIDVIYGGVNAVMGSMFGDSLLGSANNEHFMGLAGDDFINGRGGFDIAQYNNMTHTTGGITVDFALGIVTGDASTGTDTLRSVEGVQGTNFADSFDATGFGDPSHLNPALHNVGNNGTYNQFEGMAGDDTIIGNGNTRVIYFNAEAAVTVDIDDGAADGDASVGHDDFSGVNGVGGSNFADILRGSNNAQGTIEQFDARGGDDTIDGRGGFDQAIYANDPNVTAGITVNMFAGTVDGDDAVGHDTLVSVESVIGTRFGDVYDALNFVGFNEFQGLGGNDQITGNGQTQLGYYNATSGVTVDMELGTADGDASVGHDTFGGVNQIRGSNSGDTFHGDAGGNILDGLGGSDLLDGRAGTDMLIGGGGADTFVYAAGYGADTVADFNRVEGDRIDLTGVAGVHSFADVLANAVQTEGGNTLIDFGNGDTLELAGVSTLLESDFIFTVPPNDAPAVSFAPTYLHFDGGTAASGPVATANVGNGADDGVTLAGWVNWDGQGNGEDAQLLFYNGSTSDAGFGVNGFVTEDGLALHIQAGGIGGLDTGVTLAAGEWHNIALTHVDGVFTLYVDGVAEFIAEQDVNGIPGLYDYPDFTSIGGVTVSIEGQEFQADGFHGSIADVSVWNIALTEAQVQAAQFTSLSGNESGLVGYFPLNDGSGTTAADLANGEGGLTLLGDPGWTANSGDNWLADGVTINEDTPLRLTSLSVSDPDAASAPISVTLSALHGTLAFDNANIPGLTGDLNGSDGTLSLTGSQSAINAALANGVVYTPESNYSGPSQLTVTVNDQGHNGPGGAQSAEVHFDINVAPVNDAPVFTGDDLAASYTGNPVAIATSVLASDVDSDSYSGGSLTATVTDGGHEGDTLSIANTQYISLDGTNVMFDSDGSGDAQQPVLLGVLTSNYNTLTVSLNNNAGDAAVAALTQAIQFGNAKPDPEAGTRTVTFTLNDGGGAANGGHDTDYFNATVEVTAPAVNNAPVITAQTPGNHVLANSSPNDPSSHPTATALQLSNLGISGDDAVTVEFWLDYSGAVYAMPVGFDIYNLLVLDVSAANDDARAIGFNVGSGGMIGVERSDLIGQWHHIAAVFDNGDVSQSRLYIDGVEQTLEPILFGGDNGWDFISDNPRIGSWNTDTQFALDGRFDDVSIWHGARDATDIVADMQGTITGPQPGLVAAYTFENVSDGPGGVADASGNGHNATLLTLTAAANVIVDPTLSHQQTVSEDQSLVFSGANHNAITVSDLDGDDLSVTLTVAHGVVTIVPDSGVEITGGADGSATVTISGSASAINAALDGLSYHPDQDYHGADVLTVTASDGDLSNGQTIDLVVSPVNDAPVLDLDSSDAPGVATGYSANFLNDGNPLPIAAAPTVTDVDNATLTGATVVLTNGQAGDFFFVPPGDNSGTLASGIAWAISGEAGNSLTVTFSGEFSASDYAVAIEQVSFGTTSTIAGERDIAVTVNDGFAASSTAVSAITVDVAPIDNDAPVAGNDGVNVLPNYLAVASSLITNDSDPDDDTFAISGAAYDEAQATLSDGVYVIEGQYGTLRLFATEHASVTVGGFVDFHVNAGDYIYAIGQDIDGDPIPGIPIYDLQPGQQLTDTFTYTITDSHGAISAPATVTVTFDPSFVDLNVLTAAGYDTSTLWSDLHDGDLTFIDETHLTVEIGGRTIEIDAKGLQWTDSIEDDVTLTGGLIKGIHVSDASGALFEATRFNIPAADIDAAVQSSGPEAFDAILAAYAYDSTGGSGSDVLSGGNLADYIDTGGGADTVTAGDGNDVITIQDNAAWNIDGGDGVDTIRLSGAFTLAASPEGQDLANVEILDLNRTAANAVLIEPEGLYQANADHVLRILGSASDNVVLAGVYPGHPDGQWVSLQTEASYTGDTATAGVLFDLYEYRDGEQTLATLYVEHGVTVDSGPFILSNSLQTVGDEGGGATISQLSILDGYTDGLTVTAVAGDGTLTPAGQTQGIDVIEDGSNGTLSGTGTLESINQMLAGGITYVPDTVTPPSTDMVTVTIDDGNHADTLHFIFNVAEPPLNDPVTLASTSERDIIYGTGYQDQFVFAATEGTGHDTIVNFTPGQDHIELDYAAFEDTSGPADFSHWFASHATAVNGDLLIDLNVDGQHLNQDTILLRSVALASLQASDFILPSGGGFVGG